MKSQLKQLIRRTRQLLFAPVLDRQESLLQQQQNILRRMNPRADIQILLSVKYKEMLENLLCQYLTRFNFDASRKTRRSLLDAYAETEVQRVKTNVLQAHRYLRA